MVGDLGGIVRLIFNPKLGPVGPLIRALIGGAQSTMAGGPLSHCAINRGGGRRLKSRGSPKPSSPPTNPKPDLEGAQPVTGSTSATSRAATGLRH